MKKYLLLALLSLLSPVIADAYTPDDGYYDGSAADPAGHEKSIYMRISGGQLVDLLIGGERVQIPEHDRHMKSHFTFRAETVRWPHYDYTGHGVWQDHRHVRGDFRQYVRNGGGQVNTYYHWYAKRSHGGIVRLP
jgi:hypothetical protein